MSDIFAEVDEELRAERAKKLLQKYGGLLVAAALAVIAGVAAWQFWHYYQAREAARVAQIFLDAMHAADAPAGTDPSQGRDLALAEFDKVAAEGSATYRALARMRAASIRFDAGDRDAALAAWNAVAADTGVDPLLRDFAALQSVWHQIDKGDAAALRQRLAPLAAPENPWHPLAEEAQALLDLREGHTEAARAMLKQLSQDPAAPEGVRGRAGGLLAQLGG